MALLNATVKVDGRVPSPDEVVRALRTGLRRGLNVARRRARMLAPKGGLYVNQPRKIPGRLARSIRVRVNSSGQRVVGRIGSGLFYARFVEKGAAPHEIAPKAPGRRLFFLGPDGQPAYAMRVQHPGVPARPFLEPAVRQSREQITEEIEVELQYAAGVVGDTSAARATRYFQEQGRG